MKQSDKPRPIIPPVPCEYIGEKSDNSTIFALIILFTVGIMMILAVFFYKQTSERLRNMVFI
jgi:tellurite resistance protein TehA-like permease